VSKAAKGSHLVSSGIRWAARVWSIVSLGFMLLMIGGHIVSPTTPPPTAARDLLALFFFPTGVCVGLVVAWWREGLGGAVTVGSLLAFYLILWAFDGRFPRGPYFALVAGPGALFLLLWGLARMQHRNKSRQATT
jgi:hypothetical protein